MSEWKLFEGDRADVSTFEFHEHRARAPHLEQPTHRGRLETAAALATSAAERVHEITKDMTRCVKIVDLGCGDGGLLSLLGRVDGVCAAGYDFQPSNAAGWVERGVDAYALHFVEYWDEVISADVYTITEVLEHLTDPHEMVRRIYRRGAQIVASSPWTEHAGSHDECHAWAWDMDGYASLLRQAGFRIKNHVQTGMFQVIWGIV